MHTASQEQHHSDNADRGSDQVLIALERTAMGADEPNEQLRVTVGTFKGHKFLSIRIFFRGREGDWLPTKKGATIKLREIDGVIGALQKAKALLSGGR